MIHLVTGEYPPVAGGVSDYSALIAANLQAAGQPVQVWTGHFSLPDLQRLDRSLSATPTARRILIQWTPHSFGFHSLNLLFAAWVWKRARRDKDRVEVMVHEPFVAFGEGSWRQDLAAIVHRAMIVLLLNAAAKVWVSIPSWERRLRPWCFGRPVAFEWLPVPSNLEVPGTPPAANPEPMRVGHFGTFRPDIARILQPAVREILERSDATVMLAGRGSEAFRARFAEAFPALANRVTASGALSISQMAGLLATCEILLQPYPDGISTRRGTAMAALCCGVPLVSNLGPLSEHFWRESGAVELVASPNPAHLAACAVRLMRNRPRRHSLSENARALYDSRFAVRHSITRLLGARCSRAAAA